MRKDSILASNMTSLFCNAISNYNSRDQQLYYSKLKLYFSMLRKYSYRDNDSIYLYMEDIGSILKDNSEFRCFLYGCIVGF